MEKLVAVFQRRDFEMLLEKPVEIDIVVKSGFFRDVAHGVGVLYEHGRGKL